MSLDYRDFDPKLKNQKKNEVADRRWWAVDEKDLSNSVTAVVDQICNNDQARQNLYLTSMRLYGNINPVGAAGFGYSNFPNNPLPIKERLTYNVIQAAGDTVVAKLAKNKPKPMFLTSGGSYKLQRKAKKLDKFVEGVFYENNAYEQGTQIATDAFVLGDGFTQVLSKDGRVKYDRVLAGELKVDWQESFYGQPRQLHRVKPYERDVLLAMFPEDAEKIKAAQNYKVGKGSVETLSDPLTVAESWHIPSGKNAKDGKHCITILGDAVLLNEEWKRPYFPFANLKWSKRQVGFWGQGGAEQIQSIQLEINKILWTIQRSFQLHAGTKLWIQTGSKIVKEHINNELGAMWEGEKKPEYIIPPIVPPEVYEALKDRKNDAFEQLGVSMLSAASQKPAGLNSGKAMRTYNDIESERFMVLGQSQEDYYLQLARMTIDESRELYERGEHAYKVKSANAKFIDTIDWKDVAMEEDDFIMKMFPISSLSNDPSDRLQDVQEMVQAGWITPRTAKRLMNFPDIEAMEDLDNAKEEYLHKIIEKMIDDGEYTAPEPFDDLQLAKQLVIDYYAYAKCTDVEEAHLELLRQFSDQIDMLVQKATPPPPAAPGGMPTPQANPMAPPQSDLVQNTPTAA